MFIDILKVFIL